MLNNSKNRQGYRATGTPIMAGENIKMGVGGDHLEKNMTVSYKVEYIFTTQSSNSIPRYSSKRNVSMSTNGLVHECLQQIIC